VDFTREPVVETVITPREGCKLVIRSSKGASQEEYFVDAIEVVSFGQAFFFRSIEKPKSFLLPVVDYEVLEVREARIVLKHSSSEKAIKIGKKEQKEEKKQAKKEDAPKKRERKKPSRRSRSSTEKAMKQNEEKSAEPVSVTQKPQEQLEGEEKESASSIIRSLLSPPPLISETIGHYRETYSQAFFDTEEGEDGETENLPAPSEETPLVPVEEPSEAKEKDLWNFTD